MNRRSFLKSLGALGLAPALPVPVLASAGQTVMFSASQYRWAETITRAQNRCSAAQLESALGLPRAAAEALKSKLVENGVVHGYADATGFHRAAKPLYENLLKGYVEPARYVSQKISTSENLESVSQNDSDLNIDFNDMDEIDDSDSEHEQIEANPPGQLESSLEDPISG